MQNRSTHYLAVIICFTLYSVNALATTIHVPADSTSIQAALAGANYGDTVLVAPGVYTEHLAMKNGVKLFGTHPDSCTIRRDGCVATPILLVENCDGSTEIRNFTISGAPGNNCSSGVPIGIESINSDVQIINNKIIYNYRPVYVGTSLTETQGHGLTINGGSPYITQNYIANNKTYRLGGGMKLSNSDAIVTYNIFRGNSVFNWGPDVRGGGIGIESGAPYISHNIFYDNRISGNPPHPDGGGIFVWPTANPAYIGNNIFFSNIPNAIAGNLNSVVYNGFYNNPADTSAIGGSNIFADPMFADPGSGDYHLLPCSPYIDAGDPGQGYGNEPAPNGFLVNIGLFGNTNEATISHLNFLGNDTIICPGEAFLIDAGPGFSSYAWSTGSNSQAITVSTTGDYFITVTNGPNCEGIDSIHVGFGVTPAISIEADINFICTGDTVNFVATTQYEGPNPTYRWMANDAVVGTNSPFFSSSTLNNLDEVSCILFSSDTCAIADSAVSNSIQVMVLPDEPYYHAFQNFDDDVDRIKTFSNFFGGNAGILNGDTTNPQITIEPSASAVRSGYGRSLQITYGPLDDWSMYAESFERRWFDTTTSLDLHNLFPDFAHPAFQNRSIDSIVFYCKLDAERPLALKIEFHDALEEVSSATVNIDTANTWQRIAISLQDLAGSFNPAIAKFIGLTFADYVDGEDVNSGASGILYIDDLYLVENCYSRPEFANDPDLLNYLNMVNFRHFWMAVDPVTKFALDRHIWHDLISVDAIGFQLAAYVIAHKNGWITDNLVENRVEEILYHLLYTCQHANDSMQVQNDPLRYASIKGNWAHFLDNNTLGRKDAGTEYSLFSNALLLSGVIVAGEYFDWNQSITAKADSLYRMTDWNFLYRPQDSLLYFHWEPANGYSAYFTDWFTEELDLSFLLAISSPEPAHAIPANPYFATGYNKPLCPEGNYVYSAPGANFTYYFLQMYAKFDPASPRFENAEMALAQDLSTTNAALEYLDYDQRIFGITACEGPDSAGFVLNQPGDTTFISNYHAYGYCCKFDEHNAPNGTIAVYGSGAAILFIPEAAIECQKYYGNELDQQFRDTYQYNFWSPIFGFPDAFHLDPDNSADPQINTLQFKGPWLSVPRFGIDIGPMLMNIDSYVSELGGRPSIREYFSGHPEIATNLSQFENIPVTDTLEVSVSAADSNLIICNDVFLNVKAILGGPYDLSTQLMKDDLRQAGLIPLEEPYELLGAPNATGTEQIDPSILMVSGPDAIVDWVLVTLLHPSDSSHIKTISALIQRDGDLVDLNGVSPLRFSDVSSGNYFVIVQHRNHLGIRSKKPVPVHADENPTVDFTSSVAGVLGGQNAIYGLGNGKYALYPGDFDHNGQDQNLDIVGMVFDIGLSGYLSSDFNLDGQAQNTDLQLYLIPFLGKGIQY